MDLTIFLLIVAAVTMFGLLMIVITSSMSKARNNKQGKNHRRIKNKDKTATIRDANKRLAQNPKDVNALLDLADVYFQDQDWEKCINTYGMLIEMCANHPGIDVFLVTMRHALAAFQLKKFETAYKGFMIARTLNSESFEVGYHLGYIEYRRKNYERAVANLQIAQKI